MNGEAGNLDFILGFCILFGSAVVLASALITAHYLWEKHRDR